MKPFVKFTDLDGMLVEPSRSSVRRLSDMSNWYLDTEAAKELIVQNDAVIYEMLEVVVPEIQGELAYCTTKMQPGRVGDEYFMTKGHFHVDETTAEIYYTLSGSGLLLAETKEGECSLLEMTPGAIVHVEPRWAHRTYNVGEEPLVFFAVYPATAGHDYGTIEKYGFRHTVVWTERGPTLIENPRWKGH